MARVDDRELRRRVVRIDRADDGRFLGTGFFVAPGWVLTCAHVVGTEAQVTVVPDESVHDAALTAVIVARSAEGVAGELWPFPDLALMHLTTEIEHLCVHLVDDDPDGIEGCHAWGFPQHDSSLSHPSGSPASFEFEGVDGNGFLQLKAGQAVPGLSGAPLICPRHRGVVGVVQATRGRDSEMGGWASPVSALLSGGAGVPRGLAALGRQIRVENRAAIMADRAGWHKVLPINGAHTLLERRWDTFVKQPGSSPANMLRADFGVVPFLFRDNDLADMEEWCETGPVMSVAQVTGDGGAGKTRFAIELCQRMAGRGWIAGLWPDETDEWGRRQAASVTDLPLPRLVVIDYAEVFAADTLRTTLTRLRDGAAELASVRVLLLVRTASSMTRNPLDELRQRVPSPSLLTVLNAAGEYRALTEPLSNAQRLALYTEAAARFEQAWFATEAMPGTAPSAPGRPDLSADRFALPLEVLFAAFDHALSRGESLASARPAVQATLDHERKYWHAANPPAGLDPDQHDACVALSTLVGAADDPAAHTMLAATIPALSGEGAKELRAETVHWLAGLHHGPARLNPLRPDRLGEALVAQVLIGRAGRRDHTEAGRVLLRKILHLPSNDQLANCLDVLARLTAYDTAVAECAADVLAGLHANLVSRAETQLNRKLQQPGHLTVASGLIRLLAGKFSETLTAAVPGDTGYLAELSMSYGRLGDLAGKVEQNTDAERLYLHGIDIRKDLVIDEPGNASHSRELALLYDRLGSLLQLSGDSTKAERMFRRASTIGEVLVAADPANPDYRHDLATFCERLGELARVAGQAEVVQQWLERSVELSSEQPAMTVTASTLVKPGDGSAGAGKVITFYSYKGGTGRTMALANVAWILAANGMRVLVIDMDLESPGLHRFFRPFLDPAAVTTTPGMIDLIREYQWATLSKEPRPLDYHLEFARVQKYAVSLDWDYRNGGRLDFLSAGRQNRDYAIAVTSIMWDEFYEEHGGGLFFDALRADMGRNYDYTLIDSRTGLSDVAQICTTHLPDVLVDCFTFSDQGIEGAVALAHTIADDPDRGIRILPVAMRVDEGERADAGRALARSRFVGFPSGLGAAETDRYWGSAEIPFRPFYAYEETLATFGDPPGQTDSVLSAMERLTGWVTDGAVTALPALDEAERLHVLGMFTRGRPPSQPNLLLAYAPEDRMWADWISTVLGAASFDVVSSDVTSQPPPILPAQGGRRTVIVVSPAFVRSRAAIDFAREAADTYPSGSGRQSISIVVGELSSVSPLAGLPGVDLTGRGEMGASAALLGAVGSPGVAVTDGLGRFPGSIPAVWNVSPRNASFAGRDDVLERMRDHLVGKDATVIRPVALHGPAGAGKTQVALEYAHRFKADYDLVWWVDAESPDQINRSLAQLAPRLNIRVGESDADAAWEVREKLRLGVPYDHWLLIFDNADDPADLRGLLPGGPGHVLITARSQSWTQVAEPVVLGTFARAESVYYLRRRAPALTPDEAHDLAEILGDLPLAVEIAGAWLADSGQPVADYLVLLMEEGSIGMLAQSRSAGYPRSLEATWKISLDRLAARSPAALRLLELCAFFAPEIPTDLIYGPQFIAALLPLDSSLRMPMMIGRLIQEIVQLALAKVDRQANSIQVHRLVQAYLRDHMDADKAGERRHEVHRILSEARPHRGDVDEPRNWPQFQVIWPHLEPSWAVACDSEPVRQLLIDQVRFLWKTGDYTRGLSLAFQVEEIWRAALAGETPQADSVI